ncbi:hypothetical protein [Marinobacterium lutimaris]|nr:hypothetical protein [Marinobacterium lutimaris]
MDAGVSAAMTVLIYVILLPLAICANRRDQRVPRKRVHASL